MTDPIAPSIDEVIPFTQVVSPTTVQINPLAGTAKTEPEIKAVSSSTTIVTPIVGTVNVIGRTQTASSTTVSVVPLVGTIVVHPTPTPPPPPAPDFSIMASPTSLAIQQGISGTSTITITSINGFNQPVQLTVSGAPSGVTATLSPQQVTPPAGGSTTSTLTVSVSTTATPGTYTLTVTGTSSALIHSTYISLEITFLEKWSFAIITDLHIGGLYDPLCQDPRSWEYRSLDYGANGWDDDDTGNIGDASLLYLRAAIRRINKNKEKYNIAFVVILGDFSDSAEMSELNMAKKILDTELDQSIPWIPVIGNHDLWPYTDKDEASSDLPPEKCFNDIFNEQYQKLAQKLPNWERGPLIVYDDDTLVKRYTYFQNFAFDYNGFHFIGLDFNSRVAAPFAKGVLPEADIHDFTGGTWNWFTNHLEKYVREHPESNENIILFAHHPFNEYYDPVSNLFSGFTAPELDKMVNELRKYKSNIWSEFAGHTHPKTLKTYEWVDGIMEIFELPANYQSPYALLVQIDPMGKVEWSRLVGYDLIVKADSHVDLNVTDPDNLTISKSSSEITEAIYIEGDIDADGEIEDLIMIPELKLGDYTIKVIPETEATLTDRYSLEVFGSDARIVLAEDCLISNIPAEPFILSSSTLNVPPTTQMNIGEPKFVVDNVTFLTSSTSISLIGEDNVGGSGVALTAYRIYNAFYDSEWITYTEPFYLTGLSDGTYYIEFNSTDNAGNIEATKSIQVTLFSWNYVFEDSYGRGTILKINIEHKFFQFITPDGDYGIRKATRMQVYRARFIIIQHRDDELRLITLTIDTKLDFCVAIAWDVQTGKQYFLIDKPGKE
jgi:hypothetical protein